MEPKNGSMCWFELATTDAAGARDFYSKTFGWSANEVPMSADFYYSIFQIGGKDVAGGYPLTKEMLANGVPPHWMLYVKTSSSDDAHAKALQLGATSIEAPFDVPHVGRMSVIKDPTGAVICTFQPGGHRGTELFGQQTAPCWVDLNTSDPDKAAKFYADWLGWSYETGKDGYRHISNGGGKEDMLGGIPSDRPLPPGVPSHWMIYFLVADCAASAKKAADLGAKTMMPATPMPDVGTIAILQDPQGAVFALYQEPNRA